MPSKFFFEVIASHPDTEVIYGLHEVQQDKPKRLIGRILKAGDSWVFEHSWPGNPGEPLKDVEARALVGAKLAELNGTTQETEAPFSPDNLPVYTLARGRNAEDDTAVIHLVMKNDAGRHHMGSIQSRDGGCTYIYTPIIEAPELPETIVRKLNNLTDELNKQAANRVLGTAQQAEDEPPPPTPRPDGDICYDYVPPVVDTCRGKYHVTRVIPGMPSLLIGEIAFDGELYAWIPEAWVNDSTLNSAQLQSIKDELLKLNAGVATPFELDEELPVTLSPEVVEESPVPMVTTPTPEQNYLWEVGEAGIRGPHPFYRLRRVVDGGPSTYMGTIVMEPQMGCYVWVSDDENTLTEQEQILIDKRLRTLTSRSERTATGDGAATVYEFPGTNPKTIVLDFVPGMEEEARLTGQPAPKWVGPATDTEEGSFSKGPWKERDLSVPTTAESGVPLDSIQVDHVHTQQDAYGEGSATWNKMLKHVRQITPAHQAWLRLRASLCRQNGLTLSQRAHILKGVYPAELQDQDVYMPPEALTEEYVMRCAALSSGNSALDQLQAKVVAAQEEFRKERSLREAYARNLEKTQEGYQACVNKKRELVTAYEDELEATAGKIQDMLDEKAAEIALLVTEKDGWAKKAQDLEVTMQQLLVDLEKERELTAAARYEHQALAQRIKSVLPNA